MSNLRPANKRIFEEILKRPKVFKVEGLSNPLKWMGNYAIMYCLYKGKEFECLISVSDIDRLKNSGTWVARIRKTTDNVYVVSAKGVIHRFLTKCPKGQEVDHINRNGLDNRRENLRVVSHAVNMTNKKTYKNSSTNIPNVNIIDDKYCVVFHRKYDSPEVASEVAKKIKKILDGYSKKTRSKVVVK
jgi:hypothetical protein